MDDNHRYSYIEPAGRFSWWVHSITGHDKHSRLVTGPRCWAKRVLRKTRKKNSLSKQIG